MKSIATIFSILCIAAFGCSPKIHSESFHSRDSTTEIRDTTVTIPERADTFLLDLIDICERIHQQNELLRSKNDSLLIMNDSLANLQPLIIKNKRGGSISVRVTSSGKAEFICHEDEWKQRFDSAIRKTNVATHDSINTTVPKCESGFHRFTVNYFFITISVVLIFVGLRIAKK